jgi:hypothetical protein
LVALFTAAGAGELRGQTDKLVVEPLALLRAGLRVEPDSSPRNTGFEIFNARLGVQGGLGTLFGYLLHGGINTVDDKFRLLDAVVSVSPLPELGVNLGQFKVPFSMEELLLRQDIKYESRAQAVSAIAPARQIGASVSGAFLEERLEYEFGLFNGNGESLQNDNASFLYGGRLQFNNVGPLGFRDEFVVQVGGSLAFSRDSDVDLGLMGPLDPAAGDLAEYAGERLLWGLDLHTSYQGFFLDAEFLRAELKPEPEEGLVLATSTAQGGYLQLGYQFLSGLVEGLIRYDAFEPIGEKDRDFVLVGANLYAGYNYRVEVQYVIGLHDSPPGPKLADGQLILFLQLRI